MRDDSETAHTILRDGGLRLASPVANKNVIDASFPFPERRDNRFSPSRKLMGKLEKLAQSRFEIRELTKEDLESWMNLSEGANTSLVQSVIASSEIEGERIEASQVPILLAAVSTDEQKSVNDGSELPAGLSEYRDMYSAYVWALSADTRKPLSPEFIMEVHKRMFYRSRPDFAGVLRTQRVEIRGLHYEVETLPEEKIESFLRALCSRVNAHLERSRENGLESSFVVAAEAVIDFLAIHPFTDGNGRTARLLSTYLLERSGYHFARFYPLELIIRETRSQYYEALFRSQVAWYGKGEDLTAWLDYYTEAVYSQWIRARQNILLARERDFANCESETIRPI